MRRQLWGRWAERRRRRGADRRRMLPRDSRAALRSAARIERSDRARQGGVPIAIVRWPQQRTLVQQLAARGLPRLLLVEGFTVPVLAVDPLEDWVRLPVLAADLRARLRHLRSTMPRLRGGAVPAFVRPGFRD